MDVVGLDHVQLAMPPGEEARARAVYAGVLRMTEVAKPQSLAARGGCWFESVGTVIHIGVEEGFTPARKAPPALRVRDLEAARAHLRQAGAPVVDDDSLPDLRRFYTADPFGNRIELLQDGDGFAQRDAIPRGGHDG
jgi:catechol 2,3-dioxygenase-like lactoylglutathione lyase family enzyme